MEWKEGVVCLVGLKFDPEGNILIPKRGFDFPLRAEVEAQTGRRGC